MASGLLEQRLIHDVVGRLETGLEIAEGCFLACFAAPRKPPLGDFIEVLGAPLDSLDFRVLIEDVAVGTGIPSVWPQAVQRIDDERQRLEIHFHLLDRFGRSPFVYGRNGENRLTGIHWFVGQSQFGPADWSGILWPRLHVG